MVRGIGKNKEVSIFIEKQWLLERFKVLHIKVSRSHSSNLQLVDPQLWNFVQMKEVQNNQIDKFPSGREVQNRIFSSFSKPHFSLGTIFWNNIFKKLKNKLYQTNTNQISKRNINWLIIIMF